MQANPGSACPSNRLEGSEEPGSHHWDACLTQAPCEPTGLPEEAWELHELGDFFGPDAFGI